MKTMPKFKKSSLIPQKKREEMIRDAAEKANLLIAICILADCEGWGKVRINRFVEHYKELCDSFQRGDESLENINQQIWERFGIRIV